MTVGSAYEIHNQNRLPLSRERRREMTGQYPYYGPTGAFDYINEYRFSGKFALIGEDGDHFLKFATHPMTLLICGRFNVNNHAHVVGPRDANLVEWFQVYFESRDITAHLTRQGASRYKLRKSALLDLPMAIPSRGEQQAIVNALSDISGLLRSLDELIAKKQAIKQGLMQRLLTGETRLSGFTGPWREVTLENIADIDSESLSAGTDPGTLLDYVSLEDVKRGELLAHTSVRFGSAPSRARRVIKDMDVLFGTVRPNLQSHTIYRGGLRRPIVSTGFAVVRACAGYSDPTLLFYLLMSYLTTVQIERIIAGSNYPAVSSGDIRRLRFTIPPLDEQQAIGSALVDCDKELAVLKRRLAKARDVKQGMMQGLLSGRIRLPAKEGAV